MFTLKDVETGEAVLMQDGRPFQYSSIALAKIGKRVLADHRKMTIAIVSA